MKFRVPVILFIMLTSVLVFASNHLNSESIKIETVQEKFKAALASHKDLNIPEKHIRVFSQRLVERMQDRGIETMNSSELDHLEQYQIEKEAERAARMYSLQPKSHPNIHITSSNTRTAVSVQDSLALVALYNSTDGDNWMDNTNWMTAEPVETWYGVGISNGTVSDLCLAENNLNGSLPIEIGDLHHLQWLFLYENNINGVLPAELGNLENLYFLDLSNNDINGNIPAELGNLENLVVLYLSKNKLSGNIPTEIGNLTNLEALHLQYNNINGHIPTSIGNLSKLELLECQYNQIEGEIPTELCNLQGIDWIDLNANKLSGTIPVEFGTLTTLGYLGLNSNNLTGHIPSELSKLSNLGRLYLQNNQLDGSIPIEFGELSNLNTLYLDNNNLSGSIPAELGKLSKLRTLSLSGNQLQGSLPAELKCLNELISLDLSSNNLTGQIGSWIGNLSNLLYIYLSDNQFTGSIPSEITNLSGLIGLSLDGNQFTDLPDLRSIESLFWLFCQNNKLTFEDLEPNTEIPSLFYIPQDSVDINGPVWIVEGASITLSVDVGGSANSYLWFKDNVYIPGAFQDELTIDPVTDTDFGVYFCVITNPLCPSLTLYSRKLNIDKDALGTINIVVWHDANENGQVDATEQGLGGIQVRIPFEDKVSKHLTNKSGKAGFRLPAGSYTVQLLRDDLPTGARCTTDGLELKVKLDQNTRYTTIYFGFNGANVAEEADDPVNRPVEEENVPSDDDLVVIDGSKTFDNGKVIRDWSNAIDGLETGWDGTTLAMPDSSGTETVPWAIFSFADEQIYKFNYIKFKTDNGSDDDDAHKVLQVREIEVLVSTTGTENEDFTSLGIFVDKYSKDKMQWCKLDAYAFARYIKIRLLDPVVPGHWTEIVEFALDTSEKTGPVRTTNEEHVVTVPEEMTLLSNYPNPFNPSTKIVYRVTKESQVSLRIYDIVGKQVGELVNNRQSAGQYEISWHAGDMPSGVYFVSLKSGTDMATKRILLMK